ncbi:MAG: hypothetical protein UU05_C0024G0018 [Candidatus Curtissbacteria bacterium GW2011_GWA1_40_47]|nr:MAG: hypothetical protein UT95_C0015G0014 [Candidatus Curtissbacteria bacterium GW2011_GWB1_40_28]KKR60905.1 MAG: hypothetical protein UT99_C0005G0020 [Candidatus Curtissbacteria bacterium GW2011_GWA2_40_31]KKR61462.1 MAG: hypothetical protein UU00_C0013G0038 [Microgenomates group bacterium GW2011_GWC1_40_35]KKR65251.1 MAG: hypothetical protein UU05_C0024G0018 [Candidatus Curtissbacteria bacterium GW2011_GWA1_40_47]KKR77604.1 MAG: hypothetical protein UU19_C0007G0013 [Candidatus Curtissbacte
MFGDMMRYGASPPPQGYDNGYFWGHHPMMGWMGGNTGAFWFFGILWLATWILVIVVLIALIRWLWKKGDKGR